MENKFKSNYLKYLKITLTIIGIIVGVILLDTLQARIFKNSPIIKWKENLADDDSWVDKGIIIDTYYCTKEKDIQTIYWKFKNSKFTCPIDNLTLEDINNRISEYFVNENNDRSNLGFHYVDTENNIIVVGLINNSEQKQSEFLNNIFDLDIIKYIDSKNMINFIQSNSNTTSNYN